MHRHLLIMRDSGRRRRAFLAITPLLLTESDASSFPPGIRAQNTRSRADPPEASVTTVNSPATRGYPPVLWTRPLPRWRHTAAALATAVPYHCPLAQVSRPKIRTRTRTTSTSFGTPFRPFHSGTPRIFLSAVSPTSAQQLMMSLMVDLFSDAETRQRIFAASDPAEKKALSRTVSGFDQACWQSSVRSRR